MSQKDNESTQTIENLKYMQLFCQDFSKKWKEIEQQQLNGRADQTAGQEETLSAEGHLQLRDK